VGRAGYKLTGLGGFAQAFLSAGAGLFAGTLWSVGDRPAATFAQRFYKELRAGTNLSEATIRAREQARQQGDASWLCYVVYGHPLAMLSQQQVEPERSDVTDPQNLDGKTTIKPTDHARSREKFFRSRVLRSPEVIRQADTDQRSLS
jgi:CHAT domain-containing protein